MAYAAEAIAARLQMCRQHFAHHRACREINVAHDAGASANGAVGTACAHRSHAIDEFSFSQGFERIRCVGAIHRPALNKDRRADVVSGIEISQEFRQQIADGAADDLVETMLWHGPIGKHRFGPIP